MTCFVSFVVDCLNSAEYKTGRERKEVKERTLKFLRSWAEFWQVLDCKWLI